MRQDGTCAFYFDKDELRQLCEESSRECVDRDGAVAAPAGGDEGAEGAGPAGDGSQIETALREEESGYIMRQYANRQQKQARYRVWVQAKYVKVTL